MTEERFKWDGWYISLFIVALLSLSGELFIIYKFFWFSRKKNKTYGFKMLILLSLSDFIMSFANIPNYLAIIINNKY